jgi:hypothetical protein
MRKGFAPLYLALVHHPVLNRRGEVIASAVTNLDLHDLARCACTYGLPACFVITPLRDQQALVERLIRHWREGVGSELAPDRERALRLLRLVGSIEEAKANLTAECGTTARDGYDGLRYAEARSQLLDEPTPVLLLLGTGWGLADTVMGEVEGILEPINGSNGYNHLSVRCAAAIMLDRLLSLPSER